LAIRRSLGSRRDTSRTLNNLANVAWLEGDFDASEKLLAEAIDLALDLDDRYAVAAGHLNLGGMLLDAGHVDRAADQLQLALTEFEALGDSIHTAWVRTRLAWVGLAQEKLDLAQRHLQAARSTFNASQTPEYEIEILIGEAALALRRRQFGRAQRRIAAAMDPRYESVAYDVPATIELLAAVAASLGRPEVSAFLWGASASESRRSNWRRTGWAYRWRPEYRNLARKALGDSRFRRALVAGASADWSEVLLTAHKGIASLGRLLGSVKPGNEVSSRPQRNRDRSLTMQEL
jgi:predicted negative regulator of RcsB-dependent stress response